MLAVFGPEKRAALLAPRTMPPQARPLGAPERLTDQQRARLKEVFDQLDTDGSDDLDYDELKNSLQQFGVPTAGLELTTSILPHACLAKRLLTIAHCSSPCVDRSN